MYTVYEYYSILYYIVLLFACCFVVVRCSVGRANCTEVFGVLQSPIRLQTKLLENRSRGQVGAFYVYLGGTREPHAQFPCESGGCSQYIATVTAASGDRT